jgi:hypothetical protein
MRNWPKRKGSALMMVVGLLTMIGMLGATFLIITRLDARQSMIIESKSQATPLGAGIVARGADILTEYLKVDSNGPRGATRAGMAGWLDMLNYPDDALSKHLALDGVATPHKSDILGKSADLVDCDQDGVDDSYNIASGVVNSQGVEYYVALKLIDLGGKLCVNVAGSGADADLTTPWSPANINLKAFVGDAAYMGTSAENPGIHNLRCGEDQGSMVPLLQFWQECGRRILDPDTNTIQYLPFSVGDEVPLRWQGGGASARSGRLYKALKLAPADVYDSRDEMTTFSIARPLLLRARSNFSMKVTLDASTSEKRDAIYNQMVAVLKTELGWFGDDTRRGKAAAHFVANLWAYQSAGTTGAPWAYTGGGTTAYGLIPDLVITDAFAKHKKDTSATEVPNDDHAYGYAIELMNPTKTAINLASYQLTRNGGAGVALSGSLAANGGRTVIYSFGGGSGKGTPDAFFGATTSGWTSMAALDFSGSGTTTIRINRGVVPVDEVSTATDELNYSCADKDSPTNDATQSKYRDDRTTNRSRYNIAIYKDGGTGHKLGQTNGIGDGEFTSTLAKWSAKIIRAEEPMKAVGEVGRIYLTGPEMAGGTQRSFPYNMAHGPITIPGGDMSWRQDLTRAPGRADHHPIRVVGGDGWGPTWTDYPDIPITWEMWFTLLEPYVSDDASVESTGVYGLLNVNTASKKALERLAYPEDITVGGATYAVNATTAAEYIYNYREKLGSYVNRASGSGIGYLRDETNSLKKGFFHVGEVAIPLGDYAHSLMGGVAKAVNDDYIDGRDAIYTAVSNSICVQSDSYALFIRVQLGKDGGAYTWTYLAVIDTSTCEEEDDRPTVLMFTEIR